MIRAVLFDYGGVLSDGGRVDAVTNFIFALYGVHVEWKTVEPWHEKLRIGAIEPSEFFKALATICGSQRVVTVEEWNSVGSELLQRSELVYELAASLRAHGIATGILSNVYPMTAKLLREKGNYANFEPVVLSCDVHLVKP